MILIGAKLVNQVESCTRTQSVLMCFLDIANNSTFVHPGKCEGSLFVWPQQRESQWLQESFLMSQGLWAPKLTNTTELWDFTSTLTAGMCVCGSLSLYLWMYSVSIEEWHLQWDMKELSEVWAGTQRSDQKLWVSVSSVADETWWWHQPQGLKVGKGLGCSLWALWLAPQGPQAEASEKVIGVQNQRYTFRNTSFDVAVKVRWR